MFLNLRVDGDSLSAAAGHWNLSNRPSRSSFALVKWNEGPPLAGDKAEHPGDILWDLTTLNLITINPRISRPTLTELREQIYLELVGD